ncbi:MAG: DUF819 family protein [Bacteroidia bacterium]|nr:DUF819 family protein [Bacteroidia bacterium]
MVEGISALLLYLLLPACWQYAAARVRLVGWLSPAFFCYASGIAIGLGWELSAPAAALREQFQQAAVALAIPLLLFEADVRAMRRLAGRALGSQALYLGSVLASSMLAWLLFREQLHAPEEVAAMSAAVYVGSTANMAAVHAALGADAARFVEMNLSDLIVSALYYLSVLSGLHLVLIRLRLLPDAARAAGAGAQQAAPAPLQLRSFRALLPAGLLVGAAALGHAQGWLSASASLIFLTLGGLACSLLPAVRRMAGAYALGQYLFLVFCVAVGSAVTPDLLMGGLPAAAGAMAVVAYGAIMLHLLLAALFRIDAQTAVITQVAGIFSVPFIGPAASRMRNPETAWIGMTLAVLNLALGNLIGLLVYQAALAWG